jgi:hypothetical protein
MGQETDPDTVVDGTTTHAYLLENVIDFVPSAPTYPVVTDFGGQNVRSKTVLPASEFGTPTFSLSERDEEFESLFVKDNLIDSTYNTGRTITGGNFNQDTFPRTIVRFHIRRTNAVTFLTEWSVYTYLNAQIRLTGEAGAAQVTGDATNPNPFTYSLDLSTSLRDVTGTLLSAMTLGLTGNIDAVTHHVASNPIHTTTYVDDNSAPSFILGYRPISTDATGAVENNVSTNGTQSSVTSIATTTGVVTRTATGASDIVVVDYETNFIAI